MAARVQKHVETNLANMLTAEQRAAKLVHKYQEDTEHQVQVAVYRCGTLFHPKTQFQLRKLALELYLTGVVMLNKKGNVVIVEGGPKGLRRYDALVTRRIQWDELENMEVKPRTDTDGNPLDDHVPSFSDKTSFGWSPHTDCKLVWQGVVSKRLFSGFNIVDSESVAEARLKLASQGAAQYWDLALTYM
jgi:U4/U6 small nuclear ribonucleoprotein PRP3